MMMNGDDVNVGGEKKRRKKKVKRKEVCKDIEVKKVHNSQERSIWLLL